jgi:propanol-preferring alcohol dehydrogenase
VLNYEKHLFEERSLVSVTANTRTDGEEFLRLAAQIPIQVSTVAYRLTQANQALFDLAHDRVNGAAVLVNPSR